MIPTNEMHYSGNLGFSGQDPDGCRTGRRPRVWKLSSHERSADRLSEIEEVVRAYLKMCINGARSSRSRIEPAFTHKSMEIHTVAQFHNSPVSLGTTPNSP